MEMALITQRNDFSFGFLACAGVRERVVDNNEFEKSENFRLHRWRKENFKYSNGKQVFFLLALHEQTSAFYAWYQQVCDRIECAFFFSTVVRSADSIRADELKSFSPSSVDGKTCSRVYQTEKWMKQEKSFD